MVTFSKLVLATGNAHKVAEMKSLLHSLGGSFQVSGADAVGGMPSVDENADSFEGNALLKAKAVHAISAGQIWVLADDSGLEVDALNGAPGIYSARYAGPDSSDSENLEKLLKALKNTPQSDRGARFVCVLSLLEPGGKSYQFRGECHGRILQQPQGSEGFGYDPIFCPKGYAQSFAVLGSSVKDRISHRAQAMLALKAFLRNQ